MHNTLYPQLIITLLFLVNTFYEARHHGEPKDEKYNMWTQLGGMFFMFLLLYWGGFYTDFLDKILTI
jgi:hypothetical protein